VIGYDAQLVRKLANKLHFQANMLLVTHAIMFAVCGAAVGWGLRVALGDRPEVLELGLGPLQAAGAVAAVAAVVGLMVASNKAAELKLRSQLALCMVQLEMNSKTLKKAMTKMAKHMSESGEWDSGEMEA
jgi:hypothetical protein